MEFLKNQIARVQDQLAGLSASQRMLAGSLMVIMVMTLMWWSSFAGRSETVVLLDQPMKGDDLARITTRLEARNVRYQIIADRIHVPAERRLELWADLSLNGLMPRNTQVALDEIIAKSSPFVSSRQQEAIWNQLKQNTLAQIVREFPQVFDAQVMIDPTSERGFRRVEPSAMVNISMRPGNTPDSKLAKAAAELVAGTVANLSPGRVKVIIDGKSFRIQDREDGAGGSDEWLELVQRSERYHESKLQRLLAMYDGAVVAVTVRPNLDRTRKVVDDVDSKKSLHKPRMEETISETTSSAQNSGGEGGAVPNGPLMADSIAAGESSAGSTETSKIEYILEPSRIRIETLSPGGELPPQTATVMIARSHFLNDYKARMASGDPDPRLLDAFISAEVVRLKPVVRNCLNLTDEAVQIEAYTDFLPAAAAPQAAASPMTSLLSGHMKEIALGALALVSLFMASQMVRKGAPAPAMATVQSSPRPAPPISAAEEAIGVVSEGNPLLDGMELDEDSVKAQQMLSQVSQMVDENPDAAATLIKRWLSRS